MSGEVDLASTEFHAFHLQAQALFGACLEGQFDLAACTNHAMPGKCMTGGRSKKPGNRPVIQRVTSGRSNLTIGGDFAFRNGKNVLRKGFVAKSVARSGSVGCDAPQKF